MKLKTILYKAGKTIETDAADEEGFAALLKDGWKDAPEPVEKPAIAATEPAPAPVSDAKATAGKGKKEKTAPAPVADASAAPAPWA